MCFRTISNFSDFMVENSRIADLSETAADEETNSHCCLDISASSMESTEIDLTSTSTSTSNPAPKRKKLNLDDQFGDFLSDARTFLTSRNKPESAHSNACSSFMKLIDEKLNLLPTKIRNETELDILKLVNDKILHMEIISICDN